MEYEQAAIRLLLPAALELQPLTANQVQDAVAQAGLVAKPLAVALARDMELVDLLTTPLLLTIAARACAGRRDLAVSGLGPAAVRRVVYDAYVVQMLLRSTTPPTLLVSILHWLHWLAQHLCREQSSLFLSERLQPTVLRSQRTYERLVGLVVGLIVGLISGPSVGLLVGLKLGPDAGLGLGLSLGLSLGSVFGLIFGLNARKIEPVEQLRWSWNQTRESWQLTALFVPLGVMVGAQFFGLGGMLAGMPAVVSIGMVLNGWARALKEHSTQPNQGILASIRNGISEGAAIGLVFGLNIGFGSWLASKLNFGLEGLFIELPGAQDSGWRGDGLVDGPVSGLVVGLLVGLFGGLGAALKHYLLRILLWREGSLPLRLIPWLESCRACLLLRRQGGAYMFWHATLQDYFAELDDVRLAELAKKVEARPLYTPNY